MGWLDAGRVLENWGNSNRTLGFWIWILSPNLNLDSVVGDELAFQSRIKRARRRTDEWFLSYDAQTFAVAVVEVEVRLEKSHA